MTPVPSGVGAGGLGRRLSASEKAEGQLERPDEEPVADTGEGAAEELSDLGRGDPVRTIQS